MNEKYLSYVDYLQSINFENILENLQKKYANKRVLIFGKGLLLDAILDNYKLKKYLNIVAISNDEYSEQVSDYKGYTLCTPFAIRTFGINVILYIDTPDFNNKKYIKSNEIAKKAVKIAPLIQKPIKPIFDKIVNKIKYTYKTLVLTKKPLTTLFYASIFSSRELQTKFNYLNKVNSLKENPTKKIRTVFLFEDATNDDFLSIYRSMKEDSAFNVLPIILLPKRLLETEEIDEDFITIQMTHFKEHSMDVIDGLDRDTNNLSCLHAFKPDLIFYQNPIYIKNDYTPEKMSENALTFSIVYNLEHTNTDTWGCDFVKKKVNNMWKIFAKNKEQKVSYELYTGTKFKNIFTELKNKNKANNVVLYIKKELNRDSEK